MRKGLGSTIRAIAVAIALVATLAPASSHAAVVGGQLAGAGTATGAGCSGALTILGVGSGSSWSFSVAFTGANTSLCATAVSPVAGGTWNPAVGGCVSGATGIVCVGPVPATGSPVETSVSFSFPLSAAYNGRATVVRL